MATSEVFITSGEPGSAEIDIISEYSTPEVNKTELGIPVIGKRFEGGVSEVSITSGEPGIIEVGTKSELSTLELGKTPR